MSEKEFEIEFEEYSSIPETLGFLDVPLGEELFQIQSLQRFGFRFSLGDLNTDFATKVQETLESCQKLGVVMVPYTGIRTPWEQARLWRQSRPTSVVNAAISKLNADGAKFLSNVLKDVGPQPSGPKITGALPGFSWHQWGEGVDSYWQVDGKPEWKDLTGYKVYAKEGKKAGLTAGGYWTSLKDWPHLQYRKSSNPKVLYTVQEIDEKMLDSFGNVENKMLGVS